MGRGVGLSPPIGWPTNPAGGHKDRPYRVGIDTEHGNENQQHLAGDQIRQHSGQEGKQADQEQLDARIEALVDLLADLDIPFDEG